MRTLTWIWRAVLFFALFAFALNNQGLVTVHWFFGAQWQAPMVFVVLLSFGVGCVFGVLAMVPSWWKLRRAVRRAPSGTAPPLVPKDAVTPPPTASESAAAYSPREAP